MGSEEYAKVLSRLHPKMTTGHLSLSTLNQTMPEGVYMKTEGSGAFPPKHRTSHLFLFKRSYDNHWQLTLERIGNDTDASNGGTMHITYGVHDFGEAMVNELLIVNEKFIRGKVLDLPKEKDGVTITKCRRRRMPARKPWHRRLPVMKRLLEDI